MGLGEFYVVTNIHKTYDWSMLPEHYPQLTRNGFFFLIIILDPLIVAAILSGEMIVAKNRNFGCYVEGFAGKENRIL